MKITINDLVKNDLTDDEIKYLLLLEFHMDFIKGVRVIRKKLGIPVAEDGETITSLKPPDERKLETMTSKLVLKLDIPYTLIGCVVSLIKWGQVLMATKPILILGSEYQLNRRMLFNKKVWPKSTNRLTDPKTKKMIDESWYRHNQSLAAKYGTSAFIPILQINKPLTKSDLIKAIKQEWDSQISPAIEDFKKSLPFPSEITHIPINEVEDYIKLLRLRLDERKKHKEIAEELHISVDSTKEKYSKIVNFLQKIGFPSLKREFFVD